MAYHHWIIEVPLWLVSAHLIGPWGRFNALCSIPLEYELAIWLPPTPRI